jgi:hypothetical protein
MIVPDAAETLDVVWPHHTASFVTREEYDGLARRCDQAEQRRNELAAILHELHAVMDCSAETAWASLPALVEARIRPKP